MSLCPIKTSQTPLSNHHTVCSCSSLSQSAKHSPLLQADVAAHSFTEAQTRLNFDDYTAAMDLFQQAANLEPQVLHILILIIKVLKSHRALRLL